MKKAWARHELRFAEARAFRSHYPYILPVRLDDTKCPSLPETIGYVDGKSASPISVAPAYAKTWSRTIFQQNTPVQSAPRGSMGSIVGW